MKKINNNDLAMSYSIATERISRLSSDLYEDLFEVDGVTATFSSEEIESLILECRKKINIEFDMIRSAAAEYNDSNPKGDE